MRVIYLLGSSLLLPLFLLAQTGVPDHVPGRLIVHHAGNPSDPSAQAAIARHGGRLHASLPALGASVIDVPAGAEDAVRQSLRNDPRFTVVEFDYYAHESGTPNDPDFSSQWHLSKIQATTAWNYTTGSSTPIAVVDSGIDSTHPDIASRLLAGWNFVTGNSNTSDVTGHGTAVAGTLGATSNNGIGVAGITWRNPILPIVVTDSTGNASYSNIAAAIQYAADHGARVINVSLGGSSASATLNAAVSYAWSRGAIVVAAAMNNSSSAPQYPAACPYAIAVSATDQNDALASFSDYGNWITLSAPGTYIETLTTGGGYGQWSGTSFAAPVVAGVAALALAVNPSLTPQSLTTLLEQNADDLGAAGYDTSFGWGRVNAYRTVVAAGGQVSTPPPPPTPPPAAPPTTVTTYRIHAGGGALTDASGLAWSADANYSGGSTWGVPNNIAGVATPSLYQTCRYGVFSYTLPVPNGSYAVDLKFAELYATGPGQRAFNVSINGLQVLSNFDVFAQAGGTFVALDKSFPVTVTNGQILIQFSAGSANLPLVNAVLVTPSTASAPTGSTTTAHVHAGGGAYTDPSGVIWSADSSYSGGSTWSASQAISNTSSQPLYQTCRYGDFSYNFAVPNGTYTVTLKFAELYATGSGQRVFNVALNGAQVLSNFDIFAQAGGIFVALDKSFPVTVTNGQIAIQFTSGSANLPMVNAIQIQ